MATAGCGASVGMQKSRTSHAANPANRSLRIPTSRKVTKFDSSPSRRRLVAVIFGRQFFPPGPGDGLLNAGRFHVIVAHFLDLGREEWIILFNTHLTGLALLGGAASFLAGFVDSMVGGGGLIQLPALLLVYAHLPFADVSSINKAASLAGTIVATARYLRHVKPAAARVVPGSLAAFCAAGLGALAATFVDTAFMRPLAALVLAGVALYTFTNKGLGTGPVGAPLCESRSLSKIPPVLLVTIPCAVIGFYDGFFGPGTVSFFSFFLVLFFGLDFLFATVEAKILNLATNLAAVVTFAARGHFHPELFLPLAACNIAGSVLGSHLAIRRGAAFVRRVFLVVVLALLARLAWASLRG